MLRDRIRKEIEKRLNEGEGFTRIYMKDGRQFDIDLCVDGNYRICNPPYAKENMQDRWFGDLEGVAEFIATA